ncbi:hypothetical protein DRW03_25800 [Corallococcus sp. H22C18031201]|nr:hypothetical protein DRW03_25800 [Corallococcus sp. H22C18031201]
MDAHLAAAQDAAADAPKGQGPEQGAAGPAHRAVVLYVAGGCNVCRDAVTFLTSKHIPFLQKDVSRDPAARQELRNKRLQAQVTYDGVPITDFGGRLVVGFSSELFDKELLQYQGRSPSAP